MANDEGGGVEDYAGWVAAMIFCRNNSDYAPENPDDPPPPTRTLWCTCRRGGGEDRDSLCVLHQLDDCDDVGVLGGEGWVWPRKAMGSVVEVVVPSTREHGIGAYLGKSSKSQTASTFEPRRNLEILEGHLKIMNPGGRAKPAGVWSRGVSRVCDQVVAYAIMMYMRFFVEQYYGE
uniref:Uncharacterized protein n=1 Tax=Oryza meridionalis TaxID=40149 RepID=A0A0E0CC71_9ORYZ